MPATSATYQFSLVKGAEQYVVRCTAGHEEEIISRLMQWAEDPDLDFDWFDAAVLARQVTQRLANRAAGREPPPAAEPDTH